MKTQSRKSGLMLIVMLFIIQGCDGKLDTQEQTAQTVDDSVQSFTGVEFEQVDSIMIDLMGNLKIYEYNPETGLFFGGDIKGGIIALVGAGPKNNELGHVIIDQKGEVLHQFKHTDNGPEGHGSGALDNFFIGNDQVGVLAKSGLYAYNLDGSFVKKYKDINTQDFVGYSNYKISAANTDGKLAIGLAKGLNEAGRAWDSLFQIVKPLRFYDLNKFESGYEDLTSGLMAKYGYPDHPVFAPKSKFPATQFPPKVVMNRKLNQASVLYPEIPRMEVYAMESGELINHIDLAPEFFGEFVEAGKANGGIKGYESLAWLNRGGRMANSKYHDLIQLGDYTLLRYNVPLPSEAVKKLIEGPGYRKDEEWPTIRRKHYKYYYQLFKDGKKVLPDFLLPALEPQLGQREFLSDYLTRGKIIGGDGLDRVYVFIPNDGEEERDYELIRVYQLKLIK